MFTRMTTSATNLDHVQAETGRVPNRRIRLERYRMLDLLLGIFLRNFPRYSSFVYRNCEIPMETRSFEQFANK